MRFRYFFFVLLFTSCASQKNKPPEVKLISAPDTVIAKASFEIDVKVLDPEGDFVKLRIDFLTGNIWESSGYARSGAVFRVAHVYLAPGSYSIFGQGEDINGNASEWKFLKTIQVR
ncbi:MAG: hypothetical protein ACPLN0_00045 [Candidatus Hydrothermia bacterium]